MTGNGVLFTPKKEERTIDSKLGDKPSTNCFLGGDVMMVGEQGEATLFY